MISFLSKKISFYFLAGIMAFAQCKTEPTPRPVAVKDTLTKLVSLQNAADDGTGTPLKNMFGINSYEWDFLQNPAAPNDRNHIYEDNMALIKSFSAVRHYLNWNKLENTEGNYTFNPTNNGSWNYDVIYTRCKQDGIMMLADIKNTPTWMVSSYPAAQQDNEDVPAFYATDRSLPASYVQQARTAFQFAARYGYNSNIDKNLVKIDSRQRWTGDIINQVQIGMGLIKYIECGNENDRWWKGDYGTQTPEQYAANMSAFYDGHRGALGVNAGVKTADPNMVVVMGGLATDDVNYVQRIVNWCKTNRGYKPDGTVNLCFDVINYHLYSNDGNIFTHKTATKGVAPELSNAGTIADAFVNLAKSLPNHPPVWVTEAGYDINQQSYQHAPAIGDRSVLLTQADWILRTSLLYARHGIQNLFFYQLFDAFPNNGQQFSTSGLAEGIKRRPAADYILQAKSLMGDYKYKVTLNQDPLVDKYQAGNKVIYILTIPDQTGRTANYTLNLGTATTVNIYNPQAGADAMVKTTIPVNNGNVTVKITETPVFLEVIQ